jgi:hypothetical protein
MLASATTKNDGRDDVERRARNDDNDVGNKDDEDASATTMNDGGDDGDCEQRARDNKEDVGELNDNKDGGE